jgi:hypothetical protein
MGERITATARKLHKIPELLQATFPTSAQSLAHSSSCKLVMISIPSRLANDGWWLCDLPSTALVRALSSPDRQRK